MKFLIYFAFCFLIIVSCAGSTLPNNAESQTDNNIIDLAVSFENIRAVKLSEIADSVSFIHLETNQQSLMAQVQSVIFSTSYIFYRGLYFDWNGKYGGSIIKRGQGPYEEIDGGKLLYSDYHFYSKGGKFIEYDITGKPTGKMKNLYTSREFTTSDFLRWSTGFSIVGDNFIVYDTRSVTLYFFDKNFETVSSRKVSQPDTPATGFTYSAATGDIVTKYKDLTILYNGINDTIFQIYGTELKPRWVVNFNHPLRSRSEVLDESKRGSVMDQFSAALHSGGSIDNIDFLKQNDSKHTIRAAYETESGVFFLMSETVSSLASLKGLPSPDPYIMYYNKNIGKITRTNEKGFVDDLLGMDFFYPKLGIFNEKMISYIWPFELMDYIDECKQKGRAINPQLLALSKKIDLEDNPILILVHLKDKL